MRWSKEERAYLRSLLKEYLKKVPDATPAEKTALRSWVMAGHSPYDNPDGLCDDFCHPLDFISAMRFWTDFCSEFSDKADKDEGSF